MVESTATETVLDWTGEFILVDYTKSNGVKATKKLYWNTPS